MVYARPKIGKLAVADLPALIFYHALSQARAIGHHGEEIKWDSFQVC